MKKQVWIFLAVVTSFGCLSTDHMNHDQASYDQLNMDLQDEKGIVTLNNEDEYVGNEIHIRTDSTSGTIIKCKKGEVTERYRW